MNFPDNLLQDVGESVPGAVAAVLKHNELAYLSSSGAAIWATQTQIRKDSVVHLGSCTKAMTAILICQLIDRKMLSFDTKISDVFASQLSSSSSVTIRQLLNHTSGMVENLDWWLIDKMYNNSMQKIRLQRLEVLLMVLRDPKYIHLSTKSYQYSNVGYVVLGAVIEKLLNVSWEEASQTLIFNPLNMTSAGFGPPADVKGHIQNTIGVRFSPTDVDNPPVMGPAGRVHCSIPDWSKFISEVLHLSRASLGLETDVMHVDRLGVSVNTFQVLLSLSNPAVTYSGGWIIADRSWAGGYCLTHSGSNTAWFATVWIAPHQDTAYLVAINAGGSEASMMANDIVTRLIKKSPPIRNDKCIIQ